VELGLFLNTHGVTNRDDDDWWHQPMPGEEMRPVESAQLAERFGYHSVWMGDHVSLPEESPASVSPVHLEGQSNPEVRHRGPDDKDVGGSKRHYPAQPNILDGAVVMGAIAAATSRIKMGPSVLIAPYRHPLSDARQFMTIDFLSKGRLVMGVGTGWMKEEFEALGHSYHGERLAVLEECIQIYDLAWREGALSFHGRFFDFDRMSIFPLPVRRPRPPIVVGAITKAGARLVARRADGLLPLLTRPRIDPHEYDVVQDEVRREAEKLGRDPGEIAMLGLTSFRITAPGDDESVREPRRNLGGTADQILSDLERFADAGYSLIAMAPICPSRSYAEFAEQAEWLGREVIPEAKKIKPKGGWRTDL
jgi:probable F420-dependent oxidoreductase